MAQRHIEWAERMVELWNSGDLEAWLDEIGSDFEFTPDPSFPDVGTYKGEELRDWMREWARTWQMVSFFDHEQALRLAKEETG